MIGAQIGPSPFLDAPVESMYDYPAVTR